MCIYIYIYISTLYTTYYINILIILVQFDSIYVPIGLYCTQPNSTCQGFRLQGLQFRSRFLGPADSVKQRSTTPKPRN